MKNGLTILALLIIMGISTSVSQDTNNTGTVRDLVSKLEKGDTDVVKAALPDLIARYQNDPGVIYLQARVATDGIEAAKLYQSVLDNFPRSEWADDALYRMYQYYYAMGLYKTADLKLQQLKKEYPRSEYLGEKTPPDITPAKTDSATPAPASTGIADTTSQAPAAGIPGSDSATSPPGQLVTPVTPDTRTHKDTSRDQPATPLPYTLQVGAFSTSENAQKQKLFFEEFGYTAEITNRVRGGRSLYLVWVGSFSTTNEARRTLSEIESKYNITPIVVER